MHALTRLLTLIPMLALLLFAGCAQKQGNTDASGRTGYDSDSVTGTPLPERREGTAFFGPNVQRGQFASVQFDFDSFAIRGSEEGKVRAVADFLRGSQASLIIAGFTDSRGTAEYNRALGEKRAGAVRERLISFGISGQRIQTVSFGMEMPVSPGNSESDHAQNRRAEFGIAR
ncbi:MAG: OmpA family protein [Verrucomicrobia bacterium]|nr:OmpA family protein [Verrucomicrobiota bacterium]